MQPTPTPPLSELDRILNAVLLLREQFRIFRRGLEKDMSERTATVNTEATRY